MVLNPKFDNVGLYDALTHIGNGQVIQLYQIQSGWFNWCSGVQVDTDLNFYRLHHAEL